MNQSSEEGGALRTPRGKRYRRLSASLVILLAASAVVAEGVTVASSSGGPSVSVMFSDYSFNSADQAQSYYGSLKHQFEAAHPGVTLNVIHVGGTDVDETNQAALVLKSSSTAPDVVNLETSHVAEFVASGYLAPVGQRLSSSAFWRTFPHNVQDQYKIGGEYYAVSIGNNDQALIYNKAMLRKAGLAVPWHPRTWDDILAAARKIKKNVPGVVPIWLGAGVPQGPFNVLEGVGNLVLASSTPMMLNARTKRWVVDSPGLREVFSLYRSVFSEGLGPANSDNLKPNGLGVPPTMMMQNKLAITLGSNWIPESWFSKTGGVYWPSSRAEVGTAPIPTSRGQAPRYGGNILAGWALAVAAKSKNKDLAWDLIKLMETPQNQVARAIAAGFIPPSSTAARVPRFVNYAPPFQAAFNSYVKYGTSIPLDPNLPVYMRALNQVTGAIAESPSMTDDSAIKMLHDAVAGQLGSSKVETYG